MKKILSLMLLLGFILIAPMAGFAQGNSTKDIPLDNQLEENLYDTIVSPMYIPCEYWPDERHQMQKGTSRTELEYFRTHNHIVNGVTFKDCIHSKVWLVTEYYCKCGLTEDRRVAQPDDHSKA